MRAVRLAGPERIEVADVADPVIQHETDAIVRVTHTAICGADLLPYHGYTPGFEVGTVLGHEFVGTLVDAGDGLAGRFDSGARVVNTSMTSDGTCAHCRAGRPTQCDTRALFGYSGVYPRLDGGQAELVRIPRADRCLWPVPDAVSTEDAVFVADILPTGFLAVERAGIGAGDVAVVLGCGPVGLMAVLCAVGAARRVIAVDGIASRRELAASLGAQAVEPDDAAEA
ncbi:MAG: alcohol dehydrogenase catalytic domain-containing protein, partial [Solirubrobacteraceae bacterium]